MDVKEVKRLAPVCVWANCFPPEQAEGTCDNAHAELAWPRGSVLPGRRLTRRLVCRVALLAQEAVADTVSHGLSPLEKDCNCRDEVQECNYCAASVLCGLYRASLLAATARLRFKLAPFSVPRKSKPKKDSTSPFVSPNSASPRVANPHFAEAAAEAAGSASGLI